MILDQETLQKYKYLPESLTKGSEKSVIVRCDYCQCITEKPYYQIFRSRKIIEKDSCNLCRGKKAVETNKIVYGCHISALKSTQEKKEKTWLEKYGVDNPNKCEKLKEKRKESCLEKYGVDHHLKSPEIRQKIKEGCLKKYGVENPFQAETCKEKSKKTCLEKYGVEYSGQNEDIKKKIKIHHQIYSGQTLKELYNESNLDITYAGFIHNKIKYGLETALSLPRYRSCLEHLLVNFLIEKGIDFEEQFTVDNLRADFYIDSHKLIIETDGLFWHSDRCIEDNSYHLKKKQVYNKNGYQSLFFREDELNSKFQIVQSIILNRLGQSARTFARKLKIKEISTQESKQFFKENHLMGSSGGVTYALLSDKIECAIQIKQEVAQLKIQRFCNRLNTSVIGGYSKLLTHIFSLYNKPILTYVDARYGIGAFLEKFGFIKQKSYISFKWTDLKKTYHRMKYPNNSGYDFGLVKIWDCGQLKYLMPTH